jgi:Carbohydrate binding domain.
MKRSHALKLRARIEQAAVSLPDGDALEAVELFPAWAADTVYALDVRVRCGGKLYKCVQAHTSQESWEPDKTPALWTEVAKPGEIPVWKQPTGAQDAYQTGDKVHYPDADGPVYVSTVNDNVWIPGVYGWEVET